MSKVITVIVMRWTIYAFIVWMIINVLSLVEAYVDASRRCQQAKEES